LTTDIEDQIANESPLKPGRIPQSNAFSAASESLSKTVFGNSNAQKIKVSPQKMAFMRAHAQPKKFDIS